MNRTFLAAALATAFVSVSAVASDHASDSKAAKAAEHKTAVTAADQPNNARDVEVAAAARSAVVDDASLSTQAKNITLVAVDGTVTLRGTVETADEKRRIETIVTKVQGVTKVVNDLTVDP